MKNKAKRKLFKRRIHRCLGILVVLFAQVILNVANAQTTILTIQKKNVTVKEVLNLIEKSSQVVFFYADKDVDLTRKISIDVKNQPISKVLDELFKNSLNAFKLDGKQVYISKKTRQVEEIVKPASKTKKITGVITDERNQTVIGVNVILDGSTSGTITDSNGFFSIEAPEDAQLKISYIGYETKLVAIKGKTTFNISIYPSAKALEEVVVVGYGSVRKKDATGAVATVSEKDFQKGFISSSADLIANTIPGVQIITPGSPSAKPSITIRGGASLNASNNPLVVIDGVPVESIDALSRINPNDIESFNVLKDASSAAIYGSRGSNGVILVTTKQGKSGNLAISFTSKSSVSQVTRLENVLTGDEYRAVAQDAANFAKVPITTFNLGTANTNWQKEIYQNAIGIDNNLSISGGIKNLPYRLSVGYIDRDGILLTDKYKRLNTALNVNHLFFDEHLKVTLNATASLENTPYADYRAIQSAISFDPTQPVYDETSKYGGYFEYYQLETNPQLLHGHYNPVSMLKQGTKTGQNISAVGNIQLDYKFHFLPELRAIVNAGYELGRSEYHQFIPETLFEYNFQKGSVMNAKPLAEVDNVFLEAYLNYAKDIKSINSKIDVMAGYSYYDFRTKYYNYPSYSVYGDLTQGTNPIFPFDIPENTLISFYGRLNYQFMNKYILTVTVRNDGSSRFSVKNRWGLFPSSALAWKINEESFLKDVKDISALKLRIGYGLTGQQDGIGNYGYITYYKVGGVANETYPFGNSWIAPVYPSATDFNRKWEQTATYNAAIDWGLFKDRLTGSIDYYFKLTSDLLNNVTIPVGSNFASSITKNIGNMKNSGVEVSINAIPILTKDIKWTLGFNFDYNKNEITSLSYDKSTKALYNGGILVNTPGYSRNSFYLYHQVYNATGKPFEDTMLDVNKDGLINQLDRYISDKSSTPKFMMGFNTSFSYKKLTVSMAFHSNIGQYMYYQPNDNLASVYAYLVPTNINKVYFDNNFKYAGNQYQYLSDLYLQNASFLKMDNINVSYDFGKIFKSFRSDAKLSVNASVQNVFTITKYTGTDPEAGSGNWGIDYGSNYPRPRIISLGLNLNF